MVKRDGSATLREEARDRASNSKACAGNQRLPPGEQKRVV